MLNASVEIFAWRHQHPALHRSIRFVMPLKMCWHSFGSTQMKRSWPLQLSRGLASLTHSMNARPLEGHGFSGTFSSREIRTCRRMAFFGL